MHFSVVLEIKTQVNVAYALSYLQTTGHRELYNFDVTPRLIHYFENILTKSFISMRIQGNSNW